MSSARLLPEHIADVLPAEARRIEELRRDLLDLARAFGCELVMPPLLEHLESLLSGTGHELDLKTFKLVDQLSGRTLGVRADTTPQVARIDAHLLNRMGVTRLCYCGSLLHTKPLGINGTREPLQFGVEIYGHAGLEADLEVQEIAVGALQTAGLKNITLDLGDARIVKGLLNGNVIAKSQLNLLIEALSNKDAASLAELSATLPAPIQSGLQTLLNLYGDDEVLSSARQHLPNQPLINAALNDLQWLAAHIRQSHPYLQVGFDLSDMSGYSYYSGTRFALYAQGQSDAVARGGRYDEVGAVFGRKRPAAGFSLDLKTLVLLAPAKPLRAAIRAPWGEDEQLRSAIRTLRNAGETVVCVLPGHEHEADEFACDRVLRATNGVWQVESA